MGHLRRGEGGPPTPSPPKAPWDLPLIGSLPSHVTLLFLYKKPPSHSMFHLQSMDDPDISPEAQQVIDRLRTLLSQLEKDLEEIRFKASYFELLRLHSEKHLSRNELCLLTLKNFYQW